MEEGVSQGQRTRPRLRAGAVLAWLVVQVGTCAAAANLQLGFVQDPDLREALVTGFNLPMLASESNESAGLAPEFRAAAIEREQARLNGMMRAFGFLDAWTDAVDQSPAMSTPTLPEPRSLSYSRLAPHPGEAYRIGSIEVTGLIGSGLDPRVQQDVRV